MKAPTCRQCGNPHWGVCPQRVERMSIREVRHLTKPEQQVMDRALRRSVAIVDPVETTPPTRLIVDDGEGLTAPTGQCPYCDRRREANAAVQRKRRKGAP